MAVLLKVSVHPAMADYHFDGVPSGDQLEKVKQGTVRGGVYVDGGHGVGPSPYTQSFNVPEGTVRWARLYVGVWGGKEENTGEIAVTFNGEEMDTLALGGEDDTNTNVYCSGHGVYWIYYDVTDNMNNTGPADAVATTGGEIDGRVYGMVLAAVYEEPDGEEVKYWINEGNVNLHGPGWSGELEPNDEALADFDGTVDVDMYTTARLSVVYLTGTPGLNDYLSFNNQTLCDGDNCNDIANARQSFDFKTFDVTEQLEKEANKAAFDLGDEDYVHPVLAVLTLHTEEEGDSDLTVSSITIPVLNAGNSNTITATIENIGEDPAYGFRAALFADNEIVSTASVSSLAAGKNRSIDFGWKPERDGAYILWVYADHNDKKKELCETNNNNTPLRVNVIDFTPPAIEIEQPKDGEIAATDVITVSGTVGDTSRNITVLVNGAPAAVSGAGWSAPVSLYFGFNKIVVSAVDGAHNSATEFIVVTLPEQANRKSNGISYEKSEGMIDAGIPAARSPVDINSRSIFVSIEAVFIAAVAIAVVLWLRRRSQ